MTIFFIVLLIFGIEHYTRDNGLTFFRHIDTFIILILHVDVLLFDVC